MKIPFLKVQERRIASDEPCFIIAEAGVNHNGDPRLAKQLIDIAKQAGVDAVKFQTFRAEKLVTPDAPKAHYQKESTNAEQSQFEMLKHLELSETQFAELAEYAHQQGILFLSTPFDEDSADFLEALGMVAFKIPSGELTNLPYLAHIARKQKPVLVSTGMATLSEVEQALDVLYAHGNQQVALFHCVSSYPTPSNQVNLRAMHTMAHAFQVPVGFSDHTQGITIPIVAVAMGACLIEKHFTLSRDLAGPDHQASLEPHELRAMVDAIRDAEQARGDGIKRPQAVEVDVAKVARRSLVAKHHIPQGTTITEQMLAVRRPGTGIPTALLAQVIGRVARQTITEHSLIEWEMLQ